MSNAGRNFLIGATDGLIIPFAVAAGVSNLTPSSHMVFMTGAGVAIAGTITMGISAFLESKKDPAQHAIRAALAIAAGFLAGGLAAVAAFLLASPARFALQCAALPVTCMLFVSGYFESRWNGARGWVGALRVTITGIVAATAAYLVAGLFH